MNMTKIIKKQYTTPECEMVEFKLQGMIAVSNLAAGEDPESSSWEDD